MNIHTKFRSVILLSIAMLLSISFLFGQAPAKTEGSLTGLTIIADLEYGSDPVNFIFNRTSSSPTGFTMLPFQDSITPGTYNYCTSYAASSLLLTFPASGSYQLTAEYHGGSTEITFAQEMVNGEVEIPIYAATTSTPNGIDESGNPNSDTQNNIVTIVVDTQTYILRFRRRAENIPSNITINEPSGNTFSAMVTGSTIGASDINGDTLSSLQELRWSVNSLGGTAFFTENEMTPLSNGDITVTATLVNNATIAATTGSYSLSGLSNWQPHLGIFELMGKDGKLIPINPLFSSNPSATGTYSCSIVDDYSTVKLSLMAPLDCQVYINGARVSSNGESILRIGPTHPIDGPAAITYSIKVENSQGYRFYTLNFIRETNPRLKYGRQDTSAPHLASSTGDVFGVNSSGTDKLTVQAWVRWTKDPTLITNDAFANIASQATSSDGSSGLFWLQHNNLNSSFEFAVRTGTSRSFIYSNSSVVIQRGVWYLVTGVYDGSKVKIYVNNNDVSNGSRTLTGNLSNVPATAQFNVGKMPFTTRRFPGNVRELRIWVGTARDAATIANDYAVTSTNDSNFSWPLNETAVGPVAQGNGSVAITMVNVKDEDFVACCINNKATGQVMLHRPERMDLSSADSESVVLVQASGYSGSDYRFRILGEQGSSTGMQAWDHNANNGTGGWIDSGAISTGVSIDSDLGNPAAGSYFWVPVRRNVSTTGAGRYVDDDTETGYDGIDTDGSTRSNYNTIMPLPPVAAMDANGAVFTVTGKLLGTTTYPLSKKYIILGYDAVEKGKLITGTSSVISSGAYDLKSDVTLHRIEVRTQDDVLITELKNETGWTATEDLGDTTLPVELSSFTVTTTHNGAKLQWVSQSESNLSGYHVYRAELNDFSQALQVSSLIEATNAAHTQVYVFMDSGLKPFVTYYYWLMASEYSGIYQIFGPIHATLEYTGSTPDVPVKTGLDKLYPNPFNPEISIRYGLKEAADLKLSIYNLKGQKVHSLDISSQNKGYHKYIWDASSEASGVYFIVFEAADIKEMRKITLSK